MKKEGAKLSGKNLPDLVAINEQYEKLIMIMMSEICSSYKDINERKMT